MDTRHYLTEVQALLLAQRDQLHDLAEAAETLGISSLAEKLATATELGAFASQKVSLAKKVIGQRPLP